jgi:hypothetical protein
MALIGQVAGSVLVGFVLFAILLLLVGCQTLNVKSVDRDFPGVNAAIGDSSKPITCLLFVHGIGGYSNEPPDPSLFWVGLGRCRGCRRWVRR